VTAAPSPSRSRLLAGWSLAIGAGVAAATLVAPLFRMGEMARQDRFDLAILAAAGENGCDPNLVKAVAWRESYFDPAIRGRDGELGLMQVRPVVGEEWAAATGSEALKAGQLADPVVSLRVGAWYLGRAVRQWSHAAEPYPLALAQYNAGRSSVLKWVEANSLADGDAFIARIQYPSTRAYVQAILAQAEKYRRRGEF
jgi:soluble lytic murein transglycosylase